MGLGRRILFAALLAVGVWIGAQLSGHIDEFWPVILFIVGWNAAVLVGFALAERPWHSARTPSG